MRRLLETLGTAAGVVIHAKYLKHVVTNPVGKGAADQLRPLQLAFAHDPFVCFVHASDPIAPPIKAMQPIHSDNHGTLPGPCPQPALHPIATQKKFAGWIKPEPVCV